MSHLVGKREALEDVIDDFEDGGKDLIQVMQDKHETENDNIRANFEAAQTHLSKSYNYAYRTITGGSKGSNASLISDLEHEWRDEHDALQSLISEGMSDEEVK